MAESTEDTPQIICRVRALYDFQSTDESSLSFHQGDVIEVLTQLESGWWDGWSNGERGWFPCNYVQIIDDEDDDDDDDDDDNYGNGDDVEGEDQTNNNNNSNNNEMWIPQTTNDGMIYYYNTSTGVSTWELPLDDQQNARPKSNRNRTGSNAGSETGSLASTQRSSVVRSTRSITPTTTRIQGAKNNLHARHPSDADSVINNDQLPENWAIHTMEDGSYCYINKLTNEMRWSMPTAGDEISDDDDVSRDGDHDHEHDDESVYQEADQGVPDEDTLLNDNNGDDDIEPDEKTEVTTKEGEESLPPNWTKQVTPQGRVFFHNPVSNEKTWNLANVDLATGHLKPGAAAADNAVATARLSVVPPQPLPRSPSRQTQQFRRKNLIDPGEPLTWDKLSRNIALAIHNLNLAAKDEKKVQFGPLSQTVIESIRLMLYASGTIEKESPHMRQHKVLKAHHRAIMASLAKLVLSAKLAASVWPPLDATKKMQNDANEVLVAVRNFITHAQDIKLEVKNVDPRFVLGSMHWRQRLPRNSRRDSTDSIYLNKNLGFTLDNHQKNISKVTVQLVSQVKKNSEMSVSKGGVNPTTPLLIAQFRHVCTQVSNFLNTVEEVHILDALTAEPDFRAAKQFVYNALGNLFVNVQLATDPNTGDTFLKKVEESTNILERHVEEVIAAAKKMIAQAESLPDGVNPRRLSINGRAMPPRKRPSVNGNKEPILDDLDLLTREQDTDEEEEEEENFTNGNGDSAAATRAGDTVIGEGDISDDSDLSKDDSINGEVIPSVPGRLRSDTVTSMSSNEGTTQQLHKVASGSFSPATPQELMGMPNAPGARSPRNEKIKKFFGEDTISTSNRPVRDETPKCLGYDYLPSEIVFNMEGGVRGGTLNALVERLTLHDLLDSNFIATFLLTYRSFTTTEKFLTLLEKRFLLEPPENINTEDMELWTEKKLTPVRLRVFNVMKNWLENFFNDEEDAAVLERIKNFAKTAVNDAMPFASVQLVKLVEKRLQAIENGTVDTIFKKLVLTLPQQPPPPILPKNLKRLKFIEIDPVELARQLTLMEARLYQNIKPIECLNKAWSQADSGNIAVNIKALIEQSNLITAWVGELILSQPEVRKRTSVIKHLVQVAEKCRMLNNFNTCMAILAGFDSAPIGRLRRTWDLVSARTQTTLGQLKTLLKTEKNWLQYRDILHSVNLPCLPFFGVYLSDLTFIEDGNSNYIKKSKNLINFSKRMKTAEVIREIQQYQGVPYTLTPVPDIQQYIENSLQSTKDATQLYDMSLLREPREREDEKIARLLQESGFLG